MRQPAIAAGRSAHGFVGQKPAKLADNERMLAIFAISVIVPAMKTMNISLPPTLRSYVREQAVERGYGTASAYVRELIRRDQDRQHLRGLLLEGAESPPSATADEAYFESLRTGVRRRSKA